MDASHDHQSSGRTRLCRSPYLLTAQQAQQTTQEPIGDDVWWGGAGGWVSLKTGRTPATAQNDSIGQGNRPPVTELAVAVSGVLINSR